MSKADRRAIKVMLYVLVVSTLWVCLGCIDDDTARVIKRVNVGVRDEIIWCLDDDGTLTEMPRWKCE